MLLATRKVKILPAQVVRTIYRPTKGHNFLRSFIKFANIQLLVLMEHNRLYLFFFIIPNSLVEVEFPSYFETSW